MPHLSLSELPIHNSAELVTRQISSCGAIAVYVICVSRGVFLLGPRAVRAHGGLRAEAAARRGAGAYAEMLKGLRLGAGWMWLSGPPRALRPGGAASFHGPGPAGKPAPDAPPRSPHRPEHRPAPSDNPVPLKHDIKTQRSSNCFV